MKFGYQLVAPELGAGFSAVSYVANERGHCRLAVVNAGERLRCWSRGIPGFANVREFSREVLEGSL